MIEVTPVILCGGSGTRLWPLSRTGFPKQFLCLTGKESLFQMAAQRLMGLSSQGVSDIRIGGPLIITGEEHRFLAAEQLREVGISPVAAVLEPFGRNTAPALTLAALAATESGADPVLVVTPADQTIGDEAAFTKAVQEAIRLAASPAGGSCAGSIVILGIEPDRAETGYGYIQAQDGDAHSGTARPVLRFVEKPDQATAQQYLREGSYFWNAGMFVLRASTWLRALGQLRPDILQACQTAWDARQVDDQASCTRFVRPGYDLFEAVPSESIDYAVMEHCVNSGFDTQMVPLNAGWSDLGAWDAVWQVLPKDPHGNALSGDVLVTASQGNLVHASSRLVSLVGVKDLMVVETADAVLIVDKSRSQDVKRIVSQLQVKERTECSLHRKVHRPWGWYDGIDEGNRFKVKRIQVRPGASLSLQKHHHRAEHWVVVRGTAEVTVGEQVLTLSENQSTYIPLGQTHRLANPGKVPLEIIEVQSGSYLGEDDIVRLQDTYGRS